MSELERTVMLRKPALVVRTQRPAQFMTGDRRSRHLLMAQALKAQRRGWLELEWDAPRWDQQSGQYLLKVRPIKDPPPAWRKCAIGAGAVLAALAVLGWLIWHALTALTSSALGILLLAVLAGLALLVHRGRAVDVTVVTTTQVRVRR